MKKLILRLGLSIAAVALVVVVAAKTVSPGSMALAAPPADDATVSKTDIGVTGTGRVFATPDTALASIGVDVTATTLDDALKQASDASTKLLAAVKAAGVDEKDIQTTNYSVNPITNQPKEGETPKITGYHVTNIVQIKIRGIDADNSKIGKVIDAAISAGANSLNGLYFTVDNTAPFEDQARQAAVKDAMAKAKTLADAAGVKLGKIISITEGVSSPVPVFKAGAFADAASAPGPIQTGQNEISVTVEMHYEIVQ